MKSRSCWIIAVATCVGCASGATDSAPPAQGTNDPARAATGVAVPPLPPGGPAERSDRPAPAPAAPPAVAAPAAPKSRIRLSAGTALPQTLPDGTAVMCSIDYLWQSGAAEPDVQYVWVVKTGSGRQVSGPADVNKRRGTIMMILSGVRPDEKPFEGAVFAKGATADAPPTQLSDFVDLK